MQQAPNATYALDLIKDEGSRSGDETTLAAIDLALTAGMSGPEQAISVHANHGRWIVQCHCGNAQLGSPSERRFMCDLCFNVAVAGKWRPVIWPDDYATIARELDRRPVERQHWVPGETVADLRAEVVVAEYSDRINSEAYREQFNDPEAPHTHGWPTKLPDAAMVECPECGLVVPTSLVRDDENNEAR